MMKKKIIKLFAILAAVFLGSLEVGWRFFNMVVCCKRGEQKKERKKWFELSHICLLYTSAKRYLQAWLRETPLR